FVRHLLAPTRGLADDVLSRIDGERGNADLAEREVIRTIVVTLLRFLIGNDADAHLLRDALRNWIERRALDSVHLHVANAADFRNRIEVEIERDASGRNARILSVVRGAEESLFFGGDGGEDDRAFRTRVRVRPHARHLHEETAAGAVVDRAVVDRVAGGVGFADAEVIVMRGVDDRFVAKFWIASFEFRDDVRRIE